MFFGEAGFLRRRFGGGGELRGHSLSPVGEWFGAGHSDGTAGHFILFFYFIYVYIYIYIQFDSYFPLRCETTKGVCGRVFLASGDSWGRSVIRSINCRSSLCLECGARMV